jgi:hypothetical protein
MRTIALLLYTPRTMLGPLARQRQTDFFASRELMASFA